jgi:hypothetical protein
MPFAIVLKSPPPPKGLFLDAMTDPCRPSTPTLHAHPLIDLHAGHLGLQTVLPPGAGASGAPIVVGMLRSQEAWPIAERPPALEVDADIQRMIVAAKKKLVLRRVKASMTLTRGGKFLIEGTSVRPPFERRQSHRWRLGASQMSQKAKPWS